VTARGLRRPEPLAQARITRFGSQVRCDALAPAVCSNHQDAHSTIPIQNSSIDIDIQVDFYGSIGTIIINDHHLSSIIINYHQLSSIIVICHQLSVKL
jgi:hypothetical protein